MATVFFFKTVEWYKATSSRGDAKSAARLPRSKIKDLGMPAIAPREIGLSLSPIITSPSRLPVLAVIAWRGRKKWERRGEEGRGFVARRPVTMQPRCGFFRFLQLGLRRCAPTDRLALLAFCSIGAHPGRPWSDGRDGAERVCGHYQSPALMVASNTSFLSSQSSSWHRGWATFAQTSLYEPSSGMVCK